MWVSTGLHYMSIGVNYSGIPLDIGDTHIYQIATHLRIPRSVLTYINNYLGTYVDCVSRPKTCHVIIEALGTCR